MTFLNPSEEFCYKQALRMFNRLKDGLPLFPGRRNVELCLSNAYPAREWLVTLLIPNSPPLELGLSPLLVRFAAAIDLSPEEYLPRTTQVMTSATTTTTLLAPGARIWESVFPAAVAHVSQDHCWFCGSLVTSADRLHMPFFTIEDYQKNIPSYGVKTVSFNSERCEVPIPRCNTCRSIHGVESVLGKAATLAALAIILLLLAINPLVMLAGMAVMGLLAGVWIWGRNHLPQGMAHRLRRYAREYPEAKSLLSRGWYEGSKPDPSVLKQK